MLDSGAAFVTEGFSKLILYLMVPFVVTVNYLLNKNVVSVNLPAHIPGKSQSLREIFKEFYRFKTDYSSEVFMEHVSYINGFS